MPSVPLLSLFLVWLW